MGMLPIFYELRMFLTVLFSIRKKGVPYISKEGRKVIAREKKHLDMIPIQGIKI